MDEIKPYWRNPRDNEGAVDAAAKSIEEYGYQARIVVDKKLVIIVGDTRYRALRKLGYEEVEVIVAEGLTQKQAKEYRIVDNKVGELATWNNEKLVLELRELELPKMEIFFPDIDLSGMIAESAGASAFNVNEAAIEAALAGNDAKISSGEIIRNDALTEAICPECGHQFQLV